MKKATTRDIRIKLIKTSDENIFKASREKQTFLTVIADFFVRNNANQETVEQHFYKELKENNNQEFYTQRK